MRQCPLRAATHVSSNSPVLCSKLRASACTPASHTLLKPRLRRQAGERQGGRRGRITHYRNLRDLLSGRASANAEAPASPTLLPPRLGWPGGRQASAGGPGCAAHLSSCRVGCVRRAEAMLATPVAEIWLLPSLIERGRASGSGTSSAAHYSAAGGAQSATAPHMSVWSAEFRASAVASVVAPADVIEQLSSLRRTAAVAGQSFPIRHPWRTCVHALQELQRAVVAQPLCQRRCALVAKRNGAKAARGREFLTNAKNRTNFSPDCAGPPRTSVAAGSS